MVSIYCKDTTARIEYVLHLIFSEILGVSFELTNDLDKFNYSDLIKVNYSEANSKECFTIDPAGLLEESGIVHQDIQIGKWNDLPTLFNRKKGDLPFDIFSAVFYLVSRYEEYLPFQADQYERFEADQSLAEKGNFLNIPIVDLWCIELARKLKIYDSCRNIKPSNYKFQLTIDIDEAWVYKNKGVVYCIGASIKDLLFLNIKKLVHRLKVFSNKIPDPGDTYGYLNDVQKKL